MSCSNSIYLVCCSDPSPTFSIQPCNPVIDGVVGSFTPGNIYVSTGDTINNEICWSATTTLVGNLVNYNPPGFITFAGSCIECNLPYNPPVSYGGNCLTVTGLTNAILVNCCDPTDTLNATIPSTYSGAQVMRYDDKCWSLQSFGGPGGPELIASFDGCVPCISQYPCCECEEIEIGNVLPLLAEGGNIYIDYTACDGTPTTVTGTSSNLIINICSQSGETITTTFTASTVGYTGTTYPFEPFGSDPSLSVLKSNLGVCSEEPCGPTPTPTPSETSSVTPTPTVTPTVTETPTETPTPTPTITPSPSDGAASGDLNASFNLTGECFNGIFTSGSGQLEIFPTGGIAPYSVECDTGQPLPIITGITIGGSALFTGLTDDSYTFRLSDSSGGVNDFILINVNVRGCFNAGIINITDTTCGDPDGSFEVSVDTDSYPLSVDLYLDNGGGYILFNSYTLSTIPSYISNLPEGDYYADVTDFGGATATTFSSIVTISGSTPLDYTLVVINNSNCGIPSGQVEITGLTGASYNYLWSNAQTTDIITGLTAGTYSVTVTDEFGCELTKTAEVLNSSSLGVISITTTQPGCLTSNGTVTINISGGSAPYYYSAATESTTTSSTSFTFTGVTAGNFPIFVQDASLCQLSTSTIVNGAGGLTSVSITQSPTNCDSAVNLDIIVDGAGTPFTYSYTGQTNPSNTSTYITNLNSHTFLNLPPDTYDVKITTSTGCEYSVVEVVSTTPKFSVSATTTGATCGSSNGSVIIEVGTGYTGVLDYVLSSGQSILDVNLSSYTFNNLVAGSYVITVTDQDGCFITEEFDITTSGDFGYLLTTTNCVLGDDGTASINVFAGEPPFIYSWSNGESTSSISGLSGGTYSVVVTDDNGCFEEKFFTIICTSQQVTNYNVVPVCDDLFTTTVGNKRGMSQMLNEGFLDNIPAGSSDCTLNSAVFYCNLQVSGYSGTTQWVSGDTVSFYTGYTLNDVPSDQLWVQTIQNILNGIPEIENSEINELTNSVKIFSNCSGDEDPLKNGYIEISLEIDYNISCLSVTPTSSLTPTPTSSVTPSPTPTNTPSTLVDATPSATITPTETPSTTPTTTPTSSITPTLTPTKTQTPTPSCSFKEWTISECTTGTCSGTCLCEGATSRTVYTNCSVTDLTDLFTAIYENTALTNPFTGDFQLSGSIWNSSGSGVTLVCVIGGPC
jgi:hypothetical protein